MLEGENRLKENRLRIAEKMHLYDEMAQAVRPQSAVIERLLQNPAQEEAAAVSLTTEHSWWRFWKMDFAFHVWVRYWLSVVLPDGKRLSTR